MWVIWNNISTGKITLLPYVQYQIHNFLFCVLPLPSDYIRMFRSFLLIFGLTIIFEVISNWASTTIHLFTTILEHLPERGNINNCQTSATLTQLIQLENGYLSTNIIWYCGNEHKTSKLSMFRLRLYDLPAITSTWSSQISLYFVCFLIITEHTNHATRFATK